MTTPASYGGLELWLKADAGLWKDTAGTVAATVAGDAIARWDDQSGNARNITQATAGNRPTLATAVLNSIDGVDFAAASSQYLSLPNFLTGFTTAAEIWYVLKVNNDPPTVQSRTGFVKLDNGGANSHMPWTDSNIYSTLGQGTQVNLGNPAASMSAQYRTYTEVVTTRKHQAFLDEVTVYSNYATGALSWSTTGTIGKSAGAYYFDGRLVEVFLFSQERTPLERAELMGYLDSRYAIYAAPTQKVTQTPIVSVHLGVPTARLTQEPTVVVRDATATAKVSQEPAVVVRTNAATGGVSQEPIIVVRLAGPPGVTQVPVVVVRIPTTVAGLSQEPVLVARNPSPTAGVSQNTIIVARIPTAVAGLSQGPIIVIRARGTTSTRRRVQAMYCG